MALSTPDQKKATKWFVRNAIKSPRKVANVDVLTIFQAVGEVDGWFDASPAGDGAASRALSLKADINATFDTNVDATQLAMLVAAVALARAGDL